MTRRVKEAESRDLRWYELHVVAGLLQTEDYARDFRQAA
jgi:hypothetical protein